MSPELLWIFLSPLGWLCWTIGGTWWKPVRRYIWPFTVMSFALAFHASIGATLLTTALMIATLSIGYGDKSLLLYIFRKKWVVWILMGLLYALSLAPLAYTAWGWLIIVAAYFPFAMSASNQWFPKWTHKLVEGFEGLWQGCAVAASLFFR